MTLLSMDESFQPQVFHPAKHSVTPCSVCFAPFVPTSAVNRFCSPACRQSAYRDSPAHDACLAGLRHQRRNRRMAWMRRKHAFKYLTNGGRYSGPDAVGVPRIGELNLKHFSKKEEAGT
jgi:hypothetical protein